MFEGFEV